MQKMKDPNKQAGLLRCYANRSKSLDDKQRGAEGDRKTDTTQHAAQSPSTEKQHLVPKVPQSQAGPRSNELQLYPVQAMTNLTQSSDFSSPSPLTSQFLLPWQLSGQFGNPTMQGDMHTSGVLRPGVYQSFQGTMKRLCVITT